MYKALGKKFKVDAPFPDTLGIFAKASVEPQVVVERFGMLQRYIEELVEVPDAKKNIHILGLLCLSETYDELSQKIDDTAIEQTLSDLGMGDIVYNDINDGLTAIIITKIKDEMWEDIKATCPPSDRARDAAMKVASKMLDKIVTPIVKTGVTTAKEETAEVRKKIMDKIEEMAVTAVQAKHDVLDKLNGAISSRLTPIAQDVSAAIARVTCVLLPLMLKPFVPMIQLGHQKMLVTIRRIPESYINSGSMANDFSDVFGLMDGALKVLKESTKDAVASLVGDFGSHVTNPLVGGLVNLIRIFVVIVECLIDAVVDYKLWFSIFDNMLHWRNEMLGADPRNGEALDEKCERLFEAFLTHLEEQTQLLYRRFRANLYKTLLPDVFKDCGSSTLSSEYSSFADDMEDVLFTTFFKRMAKKFNCYLWGALTLPTDTRDYKTKVHDSFLLAFRSAARRTKKGFNDCVIQHLASLVEAPIWKPVSEELIPAIKEGISPITESIPQVVRDFIDVEGMVSTTLKDELHKACELVVKEQVGAFKTEFKNAAGFDYDEPLFDDIPSFPYDYSLGAPQGASGTPATTTTTTTTY